MRPRALTIATFTLLAASFVAGCSSGEPAGPKRHVEAAGRFSFVPPRDWDEHKVADVEFSVFLGPGEPPPALEFRRDVSVPDGADAVEFVRRTSAATYDASELIQAGDFTTDSGLRGKRIVLENLTEKDGRPAQIKQIVYLFPNGGDTHAFWGSAPGEAGTKYDADFDAVARSYRIEVSP